MRRSVCVLLSCVFLLAMPTVASAASRYAYGSTYYSNIPGWNFTLVNTYASSTSTQWKVTGVTMNSYLQKGLTVVPVPIAGVAVFWNTSGTIGPMYVKVYSGSTLAYSNQCSTKHTINAGNSSVHSWAPNKLTKVGNTYGTGSVTWSQKVFPFAPFPSLSSKNPCTMSTSTY